MTDKIKGNAVVGQSGGPTVVINQSLVGVVEEACVQECIGQLYGAVRGTSGILKEDFIDLKKLSRRELDDVACTPSAALGSTRDKPDQAYCHRIFEIFRKNNVRYFFYIGGNDSASTANIVNTVAQDAGYDLKVFHIPKTIDNDLLVTDHCPGFGSAATFVANAVIGDDLDNRALPGIKLDVIMGRHAGFLTASSMLARRRKDDGPHLIYVPERPVSLEQFTKDVTAVHDRYGRCMVVLSEGIVDENHIPWAKRIQDEVEDDPHGNFQLSGTGALADFLVVKLKKALPPKSRVRADTFGYLQRSFPGLVSPVDAYEARYCGRMAVYYAAGSNTAGSICMQRFGKGDRYRIETFVTTLASVAAKTKYLPDMYINKEGNNIDVSYRDYVSPLVGRLPEIGCLIH
jgi:ATP-dependent phosphofructokinase / diphosphate-dependent phosphofructokinase